MNTRRDFIRAAAGAVVAPALPAVAAPAVPPPITNHINMYRVGDLFYFASMKSKDGLQFPAALVAFRRSEGLTFHDLLDMKHDKESMAEIIARAVGLTKHPEDVQLLEIASPHQEKPTILRWGPDKTA